MRPGKEGDMDPEFRGLGDVIGVPVRRPVSEAPDPDRFRTEPAILTHPHIPKPLHGMNPRSLKGQEWWDRARRKAYASTGYRCLACGVPKAQAHEHQWLEAHEWWRINYQEGTAVVERIVPLCHWCHSFIHSGRLQMIAGREKPIEVCVDILEHGFRILRDHKLRVFPVTLDFARAIGARTFGVRSYKIRVNPEVQWRDWRIILDGEEYRSKFRDAREWRDHYRRERDLDPWGGRRLGVENRFTRFL
jgi:hypothetical protein